MGVHYDANRRKYVVRWQDGERRRSRRFEDEAEAGAFAETVVTRSRGRPSSTGVQPERHVVAEEASRLAAERGRRGDGVCSGQDGASEANKLVL